VIRLAAEYKLTDRDRNRDAAPVDKARPEQPGGAGGRGRGSAVRADSARCPGRTRAPTAALELLDGSHSRARAATRGRQIDLKSAATGACRARSR